MADAQPRYARRSIRLRGHDYSAAGRYLVTICTRGRLPVLGEVDGATMRLSSTGTIVAACWTAIPRHFPRVDLDAWAIMPDHLHGILVLTGRGDACVAPTPPRPSSGPVGQSLSAIVGAFKSAVTREVNRTRGVSGVTIWQRGFYEQILWDADAVQRARDYIAHQ